MINILIVGKFKMSDVVSASANPHFISSDSGINELGPTNKTSNSGAGVKTQRLGKKMEQVQAYL